MDPEVHELHLRGPTSSTEQVRSREAPAALGLSPPLEAGLLPSRSAARLPSWRLLGTSLPLRPHTDSDSV